MVDAFSYLVLDVFRLGLNRKCRLLGWISLPWASFQGPEHNAFDSRFLVASRPVPDLLLFAKYLFVAARTVWCGLQ